MPPPPPSNGGQQHHHASIACQVHMISGSMDSQTSSDVFNVGNFQLPDPAGKAGGACTSALLKVLYEHKKHTAQRGGRGGDGNVMTWVSALQQMRIILQQEGFDQIPQLTSSHMVDVNKPLQIVPPALSQHASGGGTATTMNRRRAILIGINYVGQKGELRGCHNDVLNMKRYLQEREGFSSSDMVILMDNRADGQYSSPTKRNILNAFERVVQESKSGDVVFIHYSGHGGRIKDQEATSSTVASGGGPDEEDGYDETLIPLDFQQAGLIRDDDILRTLVSPMAAGVTMTCLMDSCHSGTVLDLPYRFEADSARGKMYRNNRYKAQNLPVASASISCLNILNLLAYIANACITYLIGVLGVFGTSDNATLSAKYQTLVTPAGYAFGIIWAAIFISELIWAIVQLLPAFRGSSLVRRGVGCYWIGVCVAQVGWTLVFAMEIIWLSLVAMFVLLLCLLLIVVTQYRIVPTSVSCLEYSLLKWPFLLHCGWILAASVVNMNVLLVDRQVSAEVLYYAALASLLVILAIALFALFYPTQKDLTIPLVLAWATAGIFVEMESPKQVLVTTFDSPFIFSVIKYGAIAVCGTILFLSVFVVIWNCRPIGANARKDAATRTSAATAPPSGGDYHKMAEV